MSSQTQREIAKLAFRANLVGDHAVVWDGQNTVTIGGETYRLGTALCEFLFEFSAYVTDNAKHKK